MNKTFHAYFAPVLEKETPVISARLSTPYAMVYYCQQNGAGALLPERLLRALGCRDGWYELAQPLRVDIARSDEHGPRAKAEETGSFLAAPLRDSS